MCRHADVCKRTDVLHPLFRRLQLYCRRARICSTLLSSPPGRGAGLRSKVKPGHSRCLLLAFNTQVADAARLWPCDVLATLSWAECPSSVYCLRLESSISCSLTYQTVSLQKTFCLGADSHISQAGFMLAV